MTRLVTFLMMARANGLAGGFLKKAADTLRAASGGPPPPALQLDAAPSWDALQQTLDAQTTDEETEIAKQVAAGRGPPTASANLRLFDAPDGYEPGVTLYRDGSSWCPYCQKVWMQLEEKRIPYKVERCVEIDPCVGAPDALVDFHTAYDLVGYALLLELHPDLLAVGTPTGSVAV